MTKLKKKFLRYRLIIILLSFILLLGVGRVILAFQSQTSPKIVMENVVYNEAQQEAVNSGQADPAQRDSLGSFASEPINVIGTRVGTTTTAVSFNVFTASTTYPVYIGSEVNEATVNINALSASTTAIVNFSILGSNDRECDTASTTGGSMNPVLTNEVNWFDVSPNIKDLAGSLTIPVGTSTIAWYPTNPANKSITLINLDMRCLALSVHASGTIMNAQLMTKTQ